MARDVKAGVRITGKNESKGAFDSLSRSVSKAENKFSALKKSMSGVTGGLKIAGGLLAGVGAAIGGAVVGLGVGTVRMAQSTSKTVDELSKFSRQVGINIGTLQELQFAAERNGLSVSDFRGSLVKLAKTLADIGLGTGLAVTGLKKLDPELLRSLKGAKTSGQAIEIWVERMKGIEDPAKRSAIAFALFGRTGQKMLRLLDGGPEALKKLREEARKYGLVTEEDAAKSEAFIDAQTNMQRAVDGLKNSLAVGIMPALSEAAQKMANFIAANRTDIVRMTSGLIDSMGTAITNLIDYLTKNPDALKNFMQNAVDAAKSVVDEIKDIKTFVDDVQGAFGLKPGRRDRALARTGSEIIYGKAEDIEQGGIKGTAAAAMGEIKASYQNTGPLGFIANPGPLLEGIKGAIKSQKVELVVKMPHGLRFAAGRSDPNVQVSESEEYFDPGWYE